MMNYIFAGILFFSLVFAALTGRLEPLSRAAIGQAGEAVTLCLSMLGMLCLWSGLMKIAQESGLTDRLSRLLSPVTRRCFPGISPKGAAMQAACMNLAANFLGLGNAATPLGIRAICEMKREQRAGQAATNDMAMFVVLNTASLQLIPTTTALLRTQAGARHPLDILPAVWLASLGSILVGASMAWLLSHKKGPAGPLDPALSRLRRR